MCNPKYRKRRDALWQEQGGRCCWCKRPMLHYSTPIEGNRLPENFATLEHLLPRTHPRRRTYPNGEKRLALACFRCNNARGCKWEAA